MRILFFLAVPLLLLASACSYDNGHVRRVYSSGPSCSSSSTPAESTIDVDRQFDADSIQGAGLFLEYSSGGHWQLRTSCDTATTNSDCNWDVIVTPEDGSTIVNVAASDLEGNDSVSQYPEDRVSYQLLATTGSDFDGFSFDANPGAAVLVDAYLGDTCALPYFFWIGDGAVHSGSPTNPLVLVPSAD